MRNNKRGKPGFITRLAVLCNGMLFKSPAPLNTLLHGCDPKQKPPSLYPWCYSPNGPVSWQAGEQKTPLQLIFPTGSMMMSLDVVCSRAADKDGGGRESRECVQYPWFWNATTVSLYVWHMLQCIRISSDITRLGPVLWACSISPIKWAFLTAVPLENSPEHRKHVSLTSDIHAIWLIKQPQR